MNKVIVMKFGGTSVGDSHNIKGAIEIIKSRLKRNPIILVSAISQATNILHNAGILASLGCAEKFIEARKIIENLEARHISIARDLLAEPKLLSGAIRGIESYFSEIKSALRGVNLLSELSGQSYANIVSYGELLSSFIISLAMAQNGIQNALVDAREFMVTDDDYFQGKADFGLIEKTMPSVLDRYLAKGMTVLTQGFIARNNRGAATTFGREGSDYSAAIVGMVMDAKEIEIWTDVDGIMTADPKSVKNTKFIPEISFEEAAELTAFGAKVLHPATIKPAFKKNIPVRILNTKKPTHDGTLIWDDVLLEKGHEASERQSRAGDENLKRQKVKPKCHVKSIAAKEDIEIIQLHNCKELPRHEFLTKIFETLSKNHIASDAAAISSHDVFFTVENTDGLYEKILPDLSQFAAVDIQKSRSLICLVGKGLLNSGETAESIFHVLHGYSLEMFNYGSSDISISFVVKKSELKTVVQILHDYFFGG